MSFKSHKKYLISIVLIICLFISCSKTTKIVKNTAFDTSEYHLQAGEKLLTKYSIETNSKKKEYYLKKAESELLRAESLAEKDNDQLYNNLGLLAYHKKDYNKSIENYNKAQKLNSKNKKAFFNLGKLHYEIRKEKDWQQRAEDNFYKVLNLDTGNIEANFYLGKLYYERLDFNNSEKYLNKTVKLSRRKNQKHFLNESKEILLNIGILQKIETRTPITKYIGTKNKINRSEFAYLIVNELFENKLNINKKTHQINDLPDNIYKESIQRIVNMRIMKLDNNYKFNPDKEISRIVLAKVLLRIYIMQSGNKSFGIQYSAVKSPIKDIRSSSPYFIPAMFALENKFLQLDKDKNFNKNKTINGIEALKIINNFKEILKILYKKQEKN